MLSDSVQTFTKSNLDDYLKALGKQCRKMGGKYQSFELVLVGGAAILANYQFRDNTLDIDAVMQSHSTIKDAVRAVGDAFHLPEGWLNCDFMFTSSYSKELVAVSTYYRTFSNVLQVRTVSAEYLIAMKLKAGRVYKHDLSDIIGILKEHQTNHTPITYEKIETAVLRLYGSLDAISKEMQTLIQEFTQNATGDLEELFVQYAGQEKLNKIALLGFTEKYPDVAKEENIESILNQLKNRHAE